MPFSRARACAALVPAEANTHTHRSALGIFVNITKAKLIPGTAPRRHVVFPRTASVRAEGADVASMRVERAKKKVYKVFVAKKRLFLF